MITIKQTEVFESWLDSLKDKNAQKAISKRLFRVSQGLFGDHKRLTDADGIHELRVSVGKGYRVYYLRKGELVIVLLYGGNKGTQSRDITKAKELAKDIEL